MHSFHIQTSLRDLLTMGLFHQLVCDVRQTVIALSQTFEKLFFTAVKVWRKAQKIGVGRRTVYEIDPRTVYMPPIF